MDKKPSAILKSHSSRLAVVSALLAMTWCLTGCDFMARKKAQDVVDSYNFDRRQSFFVAFPEPPKTLDWNISIDFTSSVAETNLMDGLTAIDINSDGVHVIPALSSVWDVSGDGLKYTFHLRPGVKWTDGRPLKAQDFVDSVRRLFEVQSPWARNLNFIRNAKVFIEKRKGDLGVTAPDDRTVVFYLTEPLNYFPTLVAHHSFFPVRKDLIEKFGDAWSDPKNLVTLGAYQLAPAQSDKVLILTKNATYALRAPLLKNIIFRFNVKDSEVNTFLRDGQLNAVADIPPDQLKDFQHRGDILETPILDITYLAFDVRQKPLNNPIFRRAVAISIDREDLAHSLANTVKPISDMVPPGLIGYESNRGVRYAPDVAREVLKHSGYGDLRKYGPFNLKVEPGTRSSPVVLNLKDQLEKGLGLEIKVVESEGEHSDDGDDKNKPTLILSHWLAPIPDPHNFLTLFTGDSKLNLTHWKNRDYDTFVKQASATNSLEAKEKLYSKAQHLLIEREMPVMPLYVNSRFALVQQRVQHFPLNTLGLMPFRGVDLE